MTELIIALENEEIEVEIVRSKRRSMALQIRTDGSVLARVPMRVSDRTIRRFVTSHARWIEENRSQMFARRQYLAENPYDIPEWESLTASDKKIAKQKIIERVDYYADCMGIDYGSISMRNQKIRWGSCSSKGNLNFICRRNFWTMSWCMNWRTAVIWITPRLSGRRSRPIIQIIRNVGGH